MIKFPTCKINLGLHILFKRTDGFHELETAMLELPIHDVLEIIPAEKDSFTTSGLVIPGNGNLCLKALELIRTSCSVPKVAIHLHKNIPLGGGLAGGSSDGVFILKMLNEQFNLEVPNFKLLEMSAVLGSDCAFFVDGGLQLCSGRGEIVSPINFSLKNKWICIVNLGIHVSTQEAFSHVKPSTDKISIRNLIALPLNEWKNNLLNDFEQSVFPKHPILAELKEDLYKSGAIYASMSGSGSTIYGIFEQQVQFDFPIPENGFMKWVKI